MASILGSLVHKCRKSKYFISSYQPGPKHLFWTWLIQYHNKSSIKILSAMFSGMTHIRLPFEQHSIILCLTTIHSFLSLIGHFVVGEMFSADKVNQLHGEKKKKKPRLGNSVRCHVHNLQEAEKKKTCGNGQTSASASHGSFPSLYICFA